MALDKLVDGAQLDSDLGDIADAIRAKGGTSAELEFPQGFVDAVDAIQTGTTPTGTINIISNGTYDVTDKATANVNVPGVTPTGTKQISITQNGTTTEDVTAYANAEITVNVPVGWSTLALAQNTAPSGRIEFNNSITVQQSAFDRKPITSLFAPNARLNNTALGWCTSLKTAVYKDFTSTNQFQGCTALEAIDCRGGIAANSFNGCTKLATVVIRATSVVALSNVNAFTNTPFASGKAGGTLYVPQALIASYQSASNWSTILGYSTNQIKSIESTHTDPDAPIDLTLYYVDGTPIPTT